MSKSTKLFSLALSLIFAGVFLWAGGQQEAGVKKVTIGVSLPTQDVERWVRDKENLISEAARQGADIKIQIANNDAARQIAQVENLLTGGIDVLMLAPHDAESSATSVEGGRAKTAIRMIAATQAATIPAIFFLFLPLPACPTIINGRPHSGQNRVSSLTSVPQSG